MNDKISVRQLTILVFMYSTGTTILSIPGGLTAGARQDAWMVPLVAAIASLPVIWLYLSVSKLAGGTSWSDYFERLIGKWAGKGVFLLFAFYCFIAATSVLFYMGNFVTTHIMPDTPSSATHAFYMLIIIMAGRAGAVSIARTAEIMLPYAFFMFIAMSVLLLPDMEWKRALPVLEFGFGPVLQSVLYLLSTAVFPLIVFFAFYPNQAVNSERTKKSYYKGVMAASGVMTVITLVSVLVLGWESASRHMFPSYVVARKIQVGDFLQRIEILIAALWFITVFFKLAIYFYGLVKGVTRLFGLTHTKALNFLLGLLVYTFSFVVYPNVAYMQEWDSTVYIPYVLTFAVAGPLLLLMVGIWRGRTA